MFEVAFGRDIKNTVVSAMPPVCCKTLAEARALRQVSGDLVYFAFSKRIVPSESWLWDWEKKQVNAYAKRKIQEKVRLA